MPPLVSVIITTYNQAAYIGAAIQSALDQDYDNTEVIVIDDGSTDETAERIKAFGRDVVCVRQGNRGVAASRNAGIDKARGNLFAFLDGDDLWEPGKLSAQVMAAEAQPQSGLIVCDGVQFDDTGILQASIIAPVMRARLVVAESVTAWCYREFVQQNLVATCSQALTRREVIDEVGVSDLGVSDASDWDLYLRIAARYEVTFLRQSLMQWRYVKESVSGSNVLRMMRWWPNAIAVLRKQLREGPEMFRAEVLATLRERIVSGGDAVYQYGRETDKVWARRCLLRAIREMPQSVRMWSLLVALHLPRRCAARGDWRRGEE